jgi:hypothetical protein
MTTSYKGLGRNRGLKITWKWGGGSRRKQTRFNLRSNVTTDRFKDITGCNFSSAFCTILKKPTPTSCVCTAKCIGIIIVLAPFLQTTVMYSARNVEVFKALFLLFTAPPPLTARWQPFQRLLVVLHFTLLGNEVFINRQSHD